jgi:hypothetical protein
MDRDRRSCYLYCLTVAKGGVQTPEIGVDGKHLVQASACGSVGAVFGEVELAEFCGEAAEARLEDLAWLGPRVCRHEAVIEHIMCQSPVLPAHFATLFTSFGSLERYVLEHADAIARFFAQLGDKQEWGLKGMLNRAEALSRLGSADETAMEPARPQSPGVQYFQKKRLEAQLERDLNTRLKDYCRGAAVSLNDRASAFREREVMRSATDVLFNWAFLLSPQALMDFRARLQRLNGDEAFPGLRLALSGPWPPYSFAPDLSTSAIPQS